MPSSDRALPCAISETHYGLSDLEGAKLSFFQKAKLLPDAAAAAAFVKPAILQLNALRNRFGHELSATISMPDVSKISQVLEVARPTTEFASPIESIEAFTIVACTFLIVPPPHLQRVFMEAFEPVRVHAL